MSTSSATSTATDSATVSSSTSTVAPVFVNPYATIAVKSHVPISLELRNPNYNKWKAFFRSMCGKFGLLDLLDAAPPANPDAAWEQANCYLRSRLFGSVADDVLDLAMEPDQSARDLWIAIDNLFQANKEPCTIYLHHEFHSMTQGDLSVADYCQRMKTAADALRDISHPVTESQLVLNLLRGVNSRFTSTADNIASAPVLPSFAYARNTLVLKELRNANSVQVQSETALVAANSAHSNCTGGTCHSSGGQQQNRAGGGNGGNGSKNKGKNGGRNNNRNSGGKCGGGFGGRPGQQQPWRAPSAGILGPYPQAHTAFTGPYSSPPPAGSVQPAWDQAGLVAALNGMTLHNPNSWVLNTGATSHMSSIDGILVTRLPNSQTYITVGSGHSIPIVCRGTSFLPIGTTRFDLRHVLVAPSLKSDVHRHIVEFVEYAHTQFGHRLKCLQADNGTEFVNHNTTSFLAGRGSLLRLSCPYTSPQNGKAERMIRTLNNSIRTLLLQASMPPSYWAEGLATATYLLNRRPSSSVNNSIPFQLLHRKIPNYSMLRVFGCLCYPNLSATAAHKLAPYSAACVFLGYPSSHKGYCCLNISTRRIIISCHVIFDETQFPFSGDPVDASSLDFLLQDAPAPSVIAPSLAGVEQPHLPHAPFPVNVEQRLPTGAPSTKDEHLPYYVQPAAHCGQDDGKFHTAGCHVSIFLKQGTIVTSYPAVHVFFTTSRHGGAIPVPLPTTTGADDSAPSHRCGCTHTSPAAMAEEFKALIDNGTWRLVPRPPGANVVTGKWIFKHKFHSDGSLARHKARWVVHGYSQQHGIDYDETFSPVVKPSTIRVVLSIATSRSWPIHQLDVKNAFLHGTLDETVYCQQSSGFIDPAAPDAVCLLQRSLYGLKQAPRAWYQRFATYIRQLGFTPSASDTSLFILRDGDRLAYLLLYVDDIILMASSAELLCHITARLHTEFAMTDLGDLHFFLGISVRRTPDDLFLSQRQYAVDLLQRAGMSEYHPTATPVDARAKLSASEGAPVADPTEYRSLADALQYLTLTRPEIAYAVQQVCRFMHDPHEPHLALVKRIMRYIKGSLSAGLHIGTGPVGSLTAYSDADWAGCPDSRRSTSGYCIFLGDNLVSWSSKRQTTVSRSSAEAEYRAVAHAIAECCCLRQLLQELHAPISTTTVVFCDNVSAAYMTANPVHHRCTKHIEIDIHFVREKVALGQVRVLHVPSTHQFPDFMTKGLPVQLFTDFRSSLCVRDPPAATASGY
uniref:OSJNBb0088C09.15 protein n=2 Tax=Oryza sativa subsp. japonica TaxID=39947 RepID=A0A5S6R6P4_ORYSJ|nr:OSJNBa0035I04.5 [Oryza sativa Japonica Group]CAE05956.3 OSJNBb0088C09.15 [Oryza sativa Japonica Group]